jgi:hypothetical protein
MAKQHDQVRGTFAEHFAIASALMADAKEEIWPSRPSAGSSGVRSARYRGREVLEFEEKSTPKDGYLRCSDGKY